MSLGSLVSSAAGAVGSLAGSLVGGLLGDIPDPGNEYNLAAIEAFNSVQIPSPEDLLYDIPPYLMEELIQNPLTLDVSDIQQAESALAGIQVSQDVLEAERDVLGTISEVAEKGFTAQERADLARVKTEELATERGQREAIIQSMAERGGGVTGMSGGEIAAQLLAQQAGAGRSAQRGLDIEAMKGQKMLQALGMKGDIAGRIRGQEYTEKSQAAQAADAIARFNIEQETGARTMNIQQQMAAAAERQRIAEANVEAERAMAAQPSQALQWTTQAEMDRAAGIGGQYQAMGAQQMAAETGRQDVIGSMLGAGLTAGAIYAAGPAAAVASDENSKTSITPISDLDVNEFLEKLTGYKYNYRDPEANGQGPQSGIMAQDLEQTEMGEGSVIDTPDGKVVDFGKLTGALTASMVNINDRLKALEERKKGV